MAAMASRTEQLVGRLFLRHNWAVGAELSTRM